MDTFYCIDLSLDRAGRGSWISGIADRASNDEVVGSGSDGRSGCFHALLIAKSSPGWSDTGGDDQFSCGFGQGADARGFLWRGNNAIRSGLKSESRALYNQVRNTTFADERRVKIASIERSENRDRKNLCFRIAASRNGGAHDMRIAVHRKEIHAETRYSLDGGLDSRADVKQVEDDDNAVSFVCQLHTECNTAPGQHP